MNSRPLQQKALGFSRVLLVLLLVSVQALLCTQIRNMEAAFVELPTERNYKWDARLFKSLSFGLWPVAVDWMWVRTLADQSLYHVLEGYHPPAYYDFDLATDLDPAFFEIYAYGSNYLAIIRNDAKGAEDLLKKGQRFRKEELLNLPAEFRTKYWSGEWWIPLTLAYLYLFELDNIADASIAFRESSELPKAPAYLKSLANRLETVEGQYDVGLRILGHMLLTTKDVIVKERIKQKHAQLYLGQYVYKLNRSFEAYMGTHGMVRRGPLRVLTSDEKKKYTSLWFDFLKRYNISDKDPYGGSLTLNQKGQVVSALLNSNPMGMKNE